MTHMYVLQQKAKKSFFIWVIILKQAMNKVNFSQQYKQISQIAYGYMLLKFIYRSANQESNWLYKNYILVVHKFF